MTSTVLRSRVWLRRLAGGGGYFLLYLAADAVALAHTLDGGTFAPWNAAPAISFGAAARLGPRWIPAALAAPLIAGILDGSVWSEPAAVLVRAAAEGLTGLGVIQFLRPAGTPPDAGRLRTVFVFFAASLAAAAFLAFTMALEARLAVGLHPWKAVALAAHLFIAHAVAFLAVAPLFMLPGPPRRWRPPRALFSIETFFQVAALAVISWEVFARFANAEIHFFYLLFLPFAWIVTRHGHPGAAVALTALYLAPVASDGLVGHHDQAIIELQIRLGALTVISLLLGAMVSERRLAESRMLARQADLAHFQRLNVGWEMASALAHELNQPLTAAMNYTQAALRLLDAPELDCKRVAAIMAKSVDQIERMGQTLHGLRDFMRKGELRRAPNDLREIVDDALRLVAAEINEAGVVVHTVGLAALPPVMADKTQIVQVLVNLVRNAVQSVVAAGVETAVVALEARADGDTVEVTVADNGPGLHPKVIGRLFEPFITTKDAGMGLGLSISKSILEAHEGRLWAVNGPDGGAVFHFTLPAAATEGPDA